MKRDRSIARLIQLFSIAVCFGMAVLTIQKTGLISRIGTEDVYWERARFLLGQGGATLYDGNSICSIGYSLFLVPICALVKSPYAAYKIAVLLNGIFLCGSYIMAVLTAKKLFLKERESFLSAACFFAVFCPAFAASMIYTGPEMLVQFLLWCMLYFLNELWNGGKKRDFILFTVSLIFVLFFQIEMLGAVLALLGLLHVCVRRGKISELSFLKCVLAVLLGVIVTDAAEKTVLYLFSENLNITVNSSMEVFFQCLKTGWENGYILAFIKGVFGKCYVLFLASFLLICPVLGGFVEKQFLIWKTKKDANFSLLDGMIAVFLIQLVFVTLYDNARHISTAFLSLTGLNGILSILILFGIAEAKNCKNWAFGMTGSMLALCISTFATANVFRENSVASVAGLNCGIFKLFQDKTSDVVTAVYMAACLVLSAAILFLFCFRQNTKKKTINRCLHWAGMTGTFSLFVGLNLLMLRHTAAKACTNELRDIAPFASILSELSSSDQCIYFEGSGSDEGITVIQSLMPNVAIRQIKDSEEEQSVNFSTEMTEKTVVLTGSDERAWNRTVKEGMSDFQILYMTQNYALWTRRGSELYVELEEQLTNRVETLEKAKTENVSEEELLEEEGVNLLAEQESQEESTGLTERESESKVTQSTGIESESESEEETDKKKSVKKKKETYGKKLYLAPGTYRMEVYFTGTAGSDTDGKITISDKEGTILSQNFDEQMIEADGRGAVVVTFSSREAMKNVIVQIEGTILSSVSVDHIYYRKLTSAYTIGYASESKVRTVATVIRKADEICEEKGSVTFVDDMAEETEDISLSCFKTYLSDYEVNVTTKEELKHISSTYLIGVTSSHSYYNAMDQYVIVSRSQNYTILVRRDTVQYDYFQKSEMILSDGAKLFRKAFASKGTVSDKISLEMGSYSYVCSLHWNGEVPEVASSDAAGIAFVRTDDEVLAQKVITYGELRNAVATGELVASIPLYLRTKENGIYCTVEWNDPVLINATAEINAVALLSEKYQYGQEETEFETLTAKIEQIAAQKINTDETSVVLVQNAKVVKNRQIEFDCLQEQIPDCRVRNMDFDEASDLTEDVILLTYGLSKKHFQLLDHYSILAHAGKYTLWVRNDGKLLQQAMRAGLSVLNSGKKLSMESISMMSGGVDTEVVSLPKAIYNITIQLETADLETDDKVEVRLLRDKTEDELAAEVNDLIGVGYTKKEATNAVSRQAVCGSAIYDACSFYGADEKLISVRISTDVLVENLSVRAFSWHADDIEGAILWIEML